MALPLASTPTQETYESIGTVEYYICYVLAVIAVLVFAVGAYRRVSRLRVLRDAEHPVICSRVCPLAGSLDSSNAHHESSLS